MSVYQKGHPVRGLALFLTRSLCFLLLADNVFGGPATDARAPVPLDLGSDFGRAWLIANYYHGSGTDRFSSEIVNDDFFLSANGRSDPIAEFGAFNQVVIDQHARGGQESTLCRYPARLSLLDRHGLLPDTWRKPVCPEYESTVKPAELRSLSLVFASGYFDNPASYYGHTIIKFNYANAQGDRSVLDSSLNYGADVEDSSSSPLYVLRGLFGGYTASYTRNNFFLYSHLYTNGQLRDLWEYELDLSDDEVRIIIEHSWEMKNASFPYYFFNDNCAHRIARLVELATGRDMSDTHGFWLLPTQVIRKLEGNGDQGSLIKARSYEPSLKSQFTAQYLALDQTSRDTFVEYFGKGDLEKRSSLADAPTPLLLLKLDFLDLEVAKLSIVDDGEEASIPLNDLRAAILAELFRRPTGEGRDPTARPPTPVSPLQAKPPSQIRLGYGVRNGSDIQTLSYRVADHDLLSRRSAGQENSTLIMGELQLEHNKDETHLRKVVFFNVTNISTSPLPAAMSKERTWSLALDYAPRNPACSDCSDFGLEGRTGKAARFNPGFMIYGFVGARLHSSTSYHDNVFTVAVEAGALINMGDIATLGIKSKGYSDFSAGESDWNGAIDLALDPSRRFDIRLGYARQGDDDIAEVSAAYYFD